MANIPAVMMNTVVNRILKMRFNKKADEGLGTVGKIILVLITILVVIAIIMIIPKIAKSAVNDCKFSCVGTDYCEKPQEGKCAKEGQSCCLPENVVKTEQKATALTVHQSKDLYFGSSGTIKHTVTIEDITQLNAKVTIHSLTAFPKELPWGTTMRITLEDGEYDLTATPNYVASNTIPVSVNIILKKDLTKDTPTGTCTRPCDVSNEADSECVCADKLCLLKDSHLKCYKNEKTVEGTTTTTTTTATKIHVIKGETEVKDSIVMRPLQGPTQSGQPLDLALYLTVVVDNSKSFCVAYLMDTDGNLLKDADGKERRVKKTSDECKNFMFNYVPIATDPTSLKFQVIAFKNLLECEPRPMDTFIGPDQKTADDYARSKLPDCWEDSISIPVTVEKATTATTTTTPETTTSNKYPDEVMP
jgi:hypothetical protein